MSRHFPPTFRPQRQSSRTQSSRNEDYYPPERFKKDESNPTEKSSLDIAQRFERKLAEYSASNNIFKRWILEISCWILSTLCMGAIAGIYIHIDGQTMLSSEQKITWINVLGKIAAAALIVPTSEALGQLKWNWFHKSRAMWDFEIFDKASRGPWGAVMLLFRTRGRSLAAFGALLIVLLLAIDTFFQQVVNYPDYWRMMSSYGVLPTVKDYRPRTRPRYFQQHDVSFQDKSLFSIANDYFYGNGTQPVPFGNGTRPDIPLSCPSSNCTWPIYDTLAVCSRCEEVSAILDITKTCMMTTIDWSSNWTGPITEEPFPNATVCGHFLNATSETPILLTGYVTEGEVHNTTSEALMMRTIPLSDFYTKDPKYGTGSVAFKKMRNPILDGLIVSAVDGLGSVLRNETPFVHECILFWCVQTIESSYDRGIYNEKIIAEFWNTTSETAAWPWETKPGEGGVELNYWDDIIIQSPHIDDLTYSVPNTTMYTTMVIFDDFFPAFYAAFEDTEPLLRYRDYLDGPYTQSLDYNPWLAPNNLTRYMERLATSFTNAIRSSESKRMLQGNSYAIEKFVSVQWPWLIFPFALLLLSLAFLIATMIKTSKDTATGIWKTSTMPTLIYGLPEETRGKFASEASWNGSSGDTKKVRIKLLPNLGWRVSGQSLLRSPLLPTRKQPPPGWI
jgi:hypothetical protein